MILTNPSFEILESTINPLGLIERAGRTCYKSEKKITDESAETFTKHILNRGHESVIEHAFVTVKIICDRGVTHEIVRHRIASYSQESTRYCDYKGGVEFIIPYFFNNIRATSIEFIAFNNYITLNEFTDQERVWLLSMHEAENNYKQLRRLGASPQEARSVLPNSLKTEIVMSANMREWRHFFRLRTASSAHPQMIEIARPMLTEFKHQFPVLFDDINY